MAGANRKTDILIVGGGTGGVAAALACGRIGRSCIMVESTDWVGGQLTSQAVPPDENRWIEDESGVPAATGSYLLYRDKVRQWYRDHRNLTPAAEENRKLNPGNGWLSKLCHEPAVGHAVLREMLAPHVSSGLLQIELNARPTSADCDGEVVRAVSFQRNDGSSFTIEALYVLDATEWGDLLPMTNTAYRVGSEGQKEFGEMHAHVGDADPHDTQPVTFSFALEHRPGEDHTIEKPADYDKWHMFVPPLDTGWPGPLFSWKIMAGERHEVVEQPLYPWPEQPPQALDMWRARRIVDGSIYADESLPDVTLIDRVQNDYFLKSLSDLTHEQRLPLIEEAKQQSLSFLYWMQTEAPRTDGGTGYKGLKLRGDELGTSDGFAKHIHVREARRLDALFIVHEGHVGSLQRRKDGKKGQEMSPYGVAECFNDSVGIGHYRLDLHPTTGMRNSVHAQAAPFRIPLGSLIPKTTRNLIAAGKCLGVSHIANGAYRLHPIEWNVGESAAALACYCLNQGLLPREVRADLMSLRGYQKVLSDLDVTLSWPWEQNAGL